MSAVEGTGTSTEPTSTPTACASASDVLVALPHVIAYAVRVVQSPFPLKRALHPSLRCRFRCRRGRDSGRGGWRLLSLRLLSRQAGQARPAAGRAVIAARTGVLSSNASSLLTPNPPTPSLVAPICLPASPSRSSSPRRGRGRRGTEVSPRRREKRERERGRGEGRAPAQGQGAAAAAAAAAAAVATAGLSEFETSETSGTCSAGLGTRAGTSVCTMSMCSLRWPDCTQRYVQCGQPYGFSPVCSARTCDLRLLDCTQRYEQCGHACFLALPSKKGAGGPVGISSAGAGARSEPLRPAAASANALAWRSSTRRCCAADRPAAAAAADGAVPPLRPAVAAASARAWLSIARCCAADRPAAAAAGGSGASSSSAESTTCGSEGRRGRGGL
jgi:hypothetical protein